MAAKVGLHAWNVTYHHKYKGVQLATEFDGNLMQVEFIIIFNASIC